MSASVRKTAASWKALVEEQARSRRAIGGFCRKRRLGVGSFHDHRRKLKEQGGGPEFWRMRSRGGSGVRLVLEAVRWQIEVEPGFDGGCLRQMVEALR
jgi:hypothetical protein